MLGKVAFTSRTLSMEPKRWEHHGPLHSLATDPTSPACRLCPWNRSLTLEGVPADIWRHPHLLWFVADPKWAKDLAPTSELLSIAGEHHKSRWWSHWQLSSMGSAAVWPLIWGNHHPFSGPHALLIPWGLYPWDLCAPLPRVTGTLNLPIQRIPNPPLEWYMLFYILFFYFI